MPSWLGGTGSLLARAPAMCCHLPPALPAWPSYQNRPRVPRQLQLFIAQDDRPPLSPAARMIPLNLGLAQPSVPSHCPGRTQEEDKCSPCRPYGLSRRQSPGPPLPRSAPPCQGRPLAVWVCRSRNSGLDHLSCAHPDCGRPQTPEHIPWDGSWVPSSAFRADPRLPGTSLNYSPSHCFLQ